MGQRLETGGVAFEEDGYYFVLRSYPSLDSPTRSGRLWRYDFGEDGSGAYGYGFRSKKEALAAARDWIHKGPKPREG